MENLNYWVNKELINEELYNQYCNYAKEQNKSIDELILDITKLEDTGLFNHVGRQSTVFNRLTNNNIITLRDLFTKPQIQYGTDKLGDNFYIYNEIDGIIRLLKYKYLGIYPNELEELLEFKINASLNITVTSCDFGYPGKIFNTILRNKNTKHFAFPFVSQFYKVLKSCGFDQTITKALIDIAYSNKINDITLGEFLSYLDFEEVKSVFSKVPNEYQVFINISTILLYFYNNSKKMDKQSFKPKKY